MQIYAVDNQGKLTQAWEAKKNYDYCCLECGDPLRVRAGEIRQSHFYHINPNRNCRSSQKSIQHLQVQWKLQEILEGAELEVRFPQISRIADVSWPSQKIIFEVQCSPITADEVLSRNRDYASQGFQVVWILHERVFNQWRLSAAERALTNHPHYFTNIDRNGEGMIYDQYAYIHKGVRHEVTRPYRVDLSAVVEKKITSELPRSTKERHKHWPLFFSTDQTSCQAALQIEKKWDKYFGIRKKTWRDYLRRFIIRPYLFFLHYLLDIVNEG